MHVAITVWGDRISPVFDAAQTLLVAEIRDKIIVDRKIIGFQSGIFNGLIRVLGELNVKVLICGALCEGPVKALESQGIEVIPFMTGEVEKILELYASSKDLAECTMPGCGRAHRRCCRGLNVDGKGTGK